MNQEPTSLNQRLDDLTVTLGHALEALTARLEALEAREEQGATFRCQDHQRLLTLERLAPRVEALETTLELRTAELIGMRRWLSGADHRTGQRLAALERLAAQPADPGGDALEFLTRNHYRLMFVDRDPRRGRVGFRLIIDLAANADFSLDAATFDNLVNDLGMRPTNEAATEYESVTMRRP